MMPLTLRDRLPAWLDLRRPLRWKRIGQGQTSGTGRPLRAEVIGPNTGWAVAASLPT